MQRFIPTSRYVFILHQKACLVVGRHRVSDGHSNIYHQHAGHLSICLWTEHKITKFIFLFVQAGSRLVLSFYSLQCDWLQ